MWEIWDMSLLPHPRVPSNEMSQWIRLEAKAFSEFKSPQPKAKRKMIEK
jgi:hypothetical protein